MDSRQQVELFFRELETQIEIPLRAGTLKKKNLVELFATFGILDNAKKAILNLVNVKEDLCKAIQEKEDAEYNLEELKSDVLDISSDLDRFIEDYSMNWKDECTTKLQKIVTDLELAAN